MCNCYWFVLDQVGEIDQGKFIEDRNVMCYIACVYSMGQAVRTIFINLTIYVN